MNEPTTTLGEALLPCPFCGVVPVLLGTGLVRCDSFRQQGDGPRCYCPVMITEPGRWNLRMPTWTACSERMPLTDSRVLIARKRLDGGITVEMAVRKLDHFAGFCAWWDAGDYVTHWMPLPKGPTV